MGDKKTAIALKYPQGAPAPFITAIGKGVTAQQIIETAKNNNIKIIENVELAQFLSTQEIGACVPEEVWPVLAKIFAYVIEQS